MQRYSYSAEFLNIIIIFVFFPPPEDIIIGPDCYYSLMEKLEDHLLCQHIKHFNDKYVPSKFFFFFYNTYTFRSI